MKSLNTALIKLCLVLMAGILVGFHFEIPLTVVFAGVFASLLFFLFAFFRAKGLLLQDVLFGISCLLVFFVLGIFCVHLHKPQNQPFHYQNFLPSKGKTANLLLLKIREQVKPDSYNEKFIAQVKRINGKESKGKIILLFPKDSLPTEINVGDLVHGTAQIQKIPGTLNPHQFNYRNFMKIRKVLHEASLQRENYKVLNSSTSDLRGTAENLRNKISSGLKGRNFAPEELSILQALLLGQRMDIPEEIYKNYAAAGAIHILAVSGLHVGILLLILNFLLSPLNHFKHGNLIKGLFLVASLWGYALLAGLSASVLRAVTMFSFVAIGLQLRRPSNVLNPLFISLMFLLLINPQFIYEVGFQLSYLAVFSIVLLQPLLFKVLSPRSFLVKYLWGIFTVSLAAQAGVFPLSLYYFHQFPGLFFLSNMVIIPFLAIILALGFLVISLSLIEQLPEIMAHFYSLILKSLNGFVSWVAQQEEFLFQEIGFSSILTIAFYLLLVSLTAVFTKYSYRKLMYVLGAVAVIQMVLIYENYETRKTSLIIFHRSGQSIMGQQHNRTFKVEHRSEQNILENRMLRNYMVGEGIKHLESGQMQNVYNVNGYFLLVVDSTAILEIPGLKPDYLLLTQSPRFNLYRYLETNQPKMIIADGSNFKSSVKLWTKTCAEKKIPFHYTGEKGAFIYRFKPQEGTEKF